MLIANDPTATRDYVCKVDRDNAAPTIWRLGALDPFVAAAIKDELLSYATSSKNPDGQATIKIKRGQLDVTVFRLGVKGWRNLAVRTELGTADLAFATEVEGFKGIKPQPVVKRNLVRHMHNAWVTEIANEIIGDNFLTEQETGN